MIDPSDDSQGIHADDQPAVAGLTALWSAAIRHLGELSDARHAIASALAGSNWPAERIDDLLLVMTELVVNAITHGEARAVDVAVGATPEPREMAVVIRHVDRWPSRLTEAPTMAPPQELHGRGRALVAAVADGFDTKRRAGNEVLQIVRLRA